MTNAPGESTKTIGPLLQEARTAKGLTMEDAAAASKVPIFYIRLMEQEQFHLVPDALYLSRFLTDYAAFLGLDPKKFEAQLRDQFSAARASGSSHSMSSSLDSRVDLRQLAKYLLPAAAIIPLIFIGLSLLSGRQPAVPPADQLAVSEPQSTVAQPPVPEAATTLPPAPQPPPLSARIPEGSTSAQPAAMPATQEPQGAPARYRLRVEARDTTWLSVSADGAPRKQALLRAGETASWSANDGFVLTIGNAGGVTLSLNGRPIQLRATSGQVIRNLALPEGTGPTPVGQ